jgi:hypothetical protein
MIRKGRVRAYPIFGGAGGEVRLVERCSDAASVKNRFCGAVSLAPTMAIRDFSTVIQEVVQHFFSKRGTDVQIKIEIQAECKEGFDQNTQRTVKENCNTLKFRSAEFEEEYHAKLALSLMPTMHESCPRPPRR